MRRGVVWMWMVLAGATLVPGAWAQRPPETHPSSARQDIVMGWDRSAMPGDIELWAPRTVLGYERSGALGYGSLHLTCMSNSDSAQGRCPIRDTLEDVTGVKSQIPLRFSEARSGTQTDLEVVGEIRRADATATCSLDYWSRSPRRIWTSAAGICAGNFPVGTGVELMLPGSELKRLVAGRWTAKLELVLRKAPDQQLATYTFHFDFTITDYDAVSIYFPEFPQTTPNVDLNLSYDPLAQTVGGRKPLDMCLYDGLGSQSDYLGLTVTDTSGRAPGPLGYSLWHDDGGNGDDQRLDYMIELEHAGARRRMSNGVEEQLRGIDIAKLRLVLLPGMTQPVFCVPTPLLLTTPRVPITEQRAGGYQGQLKVELRLPTSRP
ncbi:TPA: pilin protein [Stenotrophomonas maltophilia]|nr:pilin protein [Stenotrophomonas maltophilia]HDS1026001.1 pilin protein [Stenotrophomonas maltophilia]HDS1031622.1 pilin protein [Stenotrophomonas maltophilia]HDS1035099.1 pilin protein [Stenotrophomonas maltophilia]